MRILTAGIFAATALLAMGSAALAHGCHCVCPPRHHHRHVVERPVHYAEHPVHYREQPVHHVMHRVVRENYYDYSASRVVRDNVHGDWQMAPNDGQIAGPCCAAAVAPPPGPCCAAAAAPGPCCAPMGYGVPDYGAPAYGAPAYGPSPNAYYGGGGYQSGYQGGFGVNVDRRGWSGGVGYTAGGGMGGGFVDGFGQMHYSQGSGYAGSAYGGGYGYGHSYGSSAAAASAGASAGGYGYGHGH